MIEVVRETWNHEKGITREVYKLNDKKKIKIIIDKEVFAFQEDNFTTMEQDWNCDGDVYELFGAYFNIDGYSSFLTPEDIVSMIIEENAIIEYE